MNTSNMQNIEQNRQKERYFLTNEELSTPLIIITSKVLYIIIIISAFLYLIF